MAIRKRSRTKTRTVYRTKKVNLLHMVAIGTAGVASAGLLQKYFPNFPTYVPAGALAVLSAVAGKKYLGDASVPLTVVLGSMAGADILLSIPAITSAFSSYSRAKQLGNVQQLAQVRR